MEDEDLHLTIKRDELNEICTDIYDRLSTFLTTFKKRLDDKGLKYHNIEIIGGSVRIPKVQEIISQVFQCDDLKKTLNSEECIAQGASIVCATVSPFYSVQSNKLKDSYPFKISLLDLNRDKEFILAELGSNYPTKKSIILMQENNFVLQTEYKESVFGIRDPFLKKYEVELK